ncbi:hypothetical protein KY314_03380, partial [Candidatus Woesearchaeota archaeon]|nr:hypothetical protein [Candidatus Woesearchaeota archaeon]
MKHKKITIIMILILLGIIFSLNSYADPTPEEAKALAQELKDTTQVNVIPVYNEQGLVEKHFIQYQKTTETQTKIITITYQDWDKEGKRPNQQIDEYDTLIIQVKDKTNNQETTFKDHGLNGYENPENDKYLGTTDSPYVKGDVRIGDEFELYDATPAQRTQINTNYYNAMQETKTAIQQESEPVKFPEKITITDKTTEKDTTQEIPKTDIDVPGVLEIREPEEEEIFTTPKQEKQPETDKIQEGVKIPKEKSLLTEEELKLLLKEEEEKLSKLEERLKSLLTEEELKQIKEIARLAEEYEEKEKKIEKEEKLIPKQKKQEAWQKTAEAIQEAVNNIKKPEEKPIDSIKEEEKNQILEKIENEIDRAKSPKQREQAIDSIKGEIKIAVEKSEQKKLDLKEAKTDESKRIVEKSEQKQIDTITEETSKTEKKLEQKEISYPTLWKEYQEFQQTQTGKKLELTYDEYEEKQTQYIEYQKTQEGEAMQLTFEQWARSQKYAKEEKAKQ